ncbi:hypothetical protein Hanom_Chr11g01034991 [Helianthus anomalus]
MLYLVRNLLNLSIVSRCYMFKVGYCCLMLMFTSLVFVVEVVLGSEFLESCDSLFSDFGLIYDVVFCVSLFIRSISRRDLVFHCILVELIRSCISIRVESCDSVL